MIVYKYLSPERVTYFEDELLRFSPPAAMNDPHECLPAIPTIDPGKFVRGVVSRSGDTIMGRARNAKERAANRKAIIKASKALKLQYERDREYLPTRMLERYVHHANMTIGIFSVSERSDSTLMWAHYSASHTGLAVGFDASHAFFKPRPNDPPGSGILEPVSYSADRLEVSVDPVKIEPELFLRKHKDWEYEKEHRIVRLLANADVTRNTSPYPLHLFKVPLSAVREIIFGINADKPLIEGIRDRLDKTGLSGGIKLWKATMDRKTFTIRKTALSPGQSST